MVLGIDFDNTIVSYDRVFHVVAHERGLIPADLTATKAAVRRHLVDLGQEDVWTALQGDVYGTRMLDATPFPGVLDFFRECGGAGVEVRIISHKTRHPYAGPGHDLHLAAHGWLEHHGFYDPRRIGLGRDRVFFELTKAEKLGRIALAGCTHFVDDLPEILGAEGFPDRVERILFDPSGHYEGTHAFRPAATWAEVARLVGAGGGDAA